MKIFKWAFFFFLIILTIFFAIIGAFASVISSLFEKIITMTEGISK